MAFTSTLGGTEQIIIAGSFTDNITAATLSADPATSLQRGTGFNAIVSGAGSSANKITITFDRKYDSLISFVCTVMNPDAADGETQYVVIESHTVTDDTDGGVIVLRGIDEAGDIDQTFPTNSEFHFVAVLAADLDADGNRA